MSKKEMLKKIYDMRLTRVFALITFTNHKDICFQWFGSSRLNLISFVNWNFKEYNIKEIKSITRSTINYDCVIVEF